MPGRLLTAAATALQAALAGLTLAAGGAAAAPRRAHTVAGVPLPPASRPVPPSGSEKLFLSGRGFGHTVEHTRRWLTRTGLPYREVRVYRRRGVAVARFIALGARSPWRAIHVFLSGGRTYFSVVPAAPAPPRAGPSGPPPRGRPTSAPPPP